MKQKARDYQIEALNETWAALHDTEDNLLCISPTGTGKTFIINCLIKRMIKTYKGTKVLVVTHDKKIIAQNADSMKKFWKTADVGIYSAGLHRKDTTNKIIYCGIQSVVKHMKDFKETNILFIDEAHLLSPNEGTMYQKLIKFLQERNPKLRILLFSATPYRLGQGHLLESDMCDSVAFDFTQTEKFMWFVEQGYLTRLITKKAVREFDISEARMRGGEFNDQDVQRLSNTKENNIAVVQECLKYGLDREHWMIFASGIEHGNALTEQFKAHGVTAVCIHSKTENKDEELARWESGEYTALVNVGLFTTGYDFPPLDLIAVARATQSTALWVQICGRGTRCVFEGNHDLTTQVGRLAAIADGPKQDCLILDFAGNTRRLGPINAPILPKPRRKGDGNEGTAPVKSCPKCNTYNHTRATHCESCGFEFPPPVTVTSEAGTDDIMVADAMEPDIVEIPVMSVVYREKTSRKTNRLYFECNYHSFTEKYTEFLFPGFPVAAVRERFEDWWWYRLDQNERKIYRGKKGYDFPQSVGEAMDRAPNELRNPSIVRVDFNKKYKDVLGVSFDE